MSMRWTEEQQKVIDLRKRNILVSAAAGSGKTAVLVERIIQRLTDEDDPLDVDRLLIVTFTEAAAAEMKERIRNAIERALEAEPENLHLQRQATLIHSAQIMTIHSFCLSVIREHFHVIDLDPGFRIAEEGELKLLRQDVLEELIEENYAEGEQSYLDFVDSFSAGRSDSKIEEMILQLYEYSISYPQPFKWLECCERAYRLEEIPLAETVYAGKIIGYVRQRLQGAEELLEEAISICEEPDGPWPYAETLEADREVLAQLSDANRLDDLFCAVRDVKWKRLPAKKDELVSPEKKEAVKTLRETVKKTVGDLKDSYLYAEPAELEADMKAAAESMHVLVSLVREFSERFAQKKRERNLIDFGDMEQLALQILTEEKGKELIPSMSAAEYQEQFDEVMIDEYQDSNLIQEAILTSVSGMSRGRNNIFMVGDVKQSIYRFRLSRPELFLEKYHTYTLEDSPKQRIDLHKNFRSRKEVLQAANQIFEQVMRREVGGICYDEKEALYIGADYPESQVKAGHSQNRAELLLIESGELKNPQESRRIEAKAIADRIRLLLLAGQVLDKKTGAYRPVKYQDIVILTRSVKGWADLFAQVLAEEGIPAYVGSREGYFETYEVSVLLDYLKVLDNVRQDLPLAAVLTSPFGGFCTEELAKIRNAFPDVPFYEAVNLCCGQGIPEESELGEKLRKFREQLERFRDCLPYTPMHELLWNIIEETGYGSYIAAMPGGEQKSANLEMLVSKAAAYEGTSYKGLFNFVRYIEQLKKYDVDYGEANIADEQADTVRIMSIHKSKGLEFPVVFVAGLGKAFNTQDMKGSMVIHPELGVGIDCVDPVRRTKAPTLLKKVIQEEIKVENLGEELRVLYVALTRAKEKLILSGTCRHAAEKLKELSGREKKILPVWKILAAGNYLDWVLPAACTEDSAIMVSCLDPEGLVGMEQAQREAERLTKEILEHWDIKRIHEEAFGKRLEEQMNFVYPYAQQVSLKMKVTVSELKKRAYLEEDGEPMYREVQSSPLLPKFLEKEEKLQGASRGTVYHKVMELLDVSREYTEQELKNCLDGFLEEHRITAEARACIRTGEILEFLESRSGQRMRAAAGAGKLFREQPFVIGVDPKEIYSDVPCEEQILVQGIIDAYFEEDGEIVVLDYKTDRVYREEELKEKYHAQLAYYARALETMTGKRVKEKILYSFALGKEITV